MFFVPCVLCPPPWHNVLFCLQLIGKVLQEIFSAASLTICRVGGGGWGGGNSLGMSGKCCKKQNYQIKKLPTDPKRAHFGQRKRLDWSVIHKSTDRENMALLAKSLDKEFRSEAKSHRQGGYGAASKKFGQGI